MIGRWWRNHKTRAETHKCSICKKRHYWREMKDGSWRWMGSR